MANKIARFDPVGILPYVGDTLRDKDCAYVNHPQLIGELMFEIERVIAEIGPENDRSAFEMWVKDRKFANDIVFHV